MVNVASGTPSELTSAGHRGWEVVVTGLTAAVADRMRPAVVRIRETAPAQFTVELAADRRPEPFIAELAAAGAALVSVTPLRQTLEDIFMEHVGGVSIPDAPGLGVEINLDALAEYSRTPLTDLKRMLG